ESRGWRGRAARAARAGLSTVPSARSRSVTPRAAGSRRRHPRRSASSSYGGGPDFASCARSTKVLDNIAKGEVKVGGDEDTTKIKASGKASQAVASLEGSEETEEGVKKNGRLALGSVRCAMRDPLCRRCAGARGSSVTDGEA